MARAAFAERGVGCSLDDIARQARVGPGTLYRHFPSREALLDAAMAGWVDDVCASGAAILAEADDPLEAVRRWFSRLLDHVLVHKGASAMVAAMGDPSSPLYASCSRIREANETVLSTAGDTGRLRAGVEPDPVARLVLGICALAGDVGMPRGEAEAMLEIVHRGVTR